MAFLKYAAGVPAPDCAAALQTFLRAGAGNACAAGAGSRLIIQVKSGRQSADCGKGVSE